MQTKSADVRSGGKIVSTVSYNVYDTLEEAIATLGNEKTLEYVNGLEKTNALNLERSKFNKKPTQIQFRKMAQEELQKLPRDKIMEIVTGGTFDQWMDQKVAELDKAWEDNKNAGAEAVENDINAQQTQEENPDATQTA